MPRSCGSRAFILNRLRVWERYAFECAQSGNGWSRTAWRWAGPVSLCQSLWRTVLGATLSGDGQAARSGAWGLSRSVTGHGARPGTGSEAHDPRGRRPDCQETAGPVQDVQRRRTGIDRKQAPQLAGDRRVGKTAFPQRVDPASPGVGQVAVALGHDSLHLATKGLSPPSGQFATSCADPARPHPHRVLHFTVEPGRLCGCSLSIGRL